MGLKDMRWEGMDWIDLAQDRDKWGVGGSCESGNETSGSIKCRKILDYLKNY
jgi:hypothetical protein